MSDQTFRNDKVKTQKLNYHDVVRQFRIEDNILVGKELPISREPINMSEVILKILKSVPDFVGQVDPRTGKKHTYADMSERSIKCALWLKKQGVKSGDIISLCSDNHMDAVIILLATMYIGAISNPWEYQLTPVMAKHFLTLMSPKMIFAVPSSVEVLMEETKKLGMNTKIVVLDKLDGYESLEYILMGHDSHEITEFKCTPINSPDDVALIALSSGSTGMPKGTEISHSSLYNCLLPEKVAEIEGHICMWTPTLRWHYGVQLAFQAIMAYSTEILLPCDILYNEDDVTMCKYIEKYQVTWLCSAPDIAIRFSKSDILKKYPLLNLKEYMSTGSHLKQEHHKALAKILPHALIMNSYGSTESGGDLCIYVKGSKPGGVGFVAPNVRMKVVDLKTGEILGANKLGELHVKAPYVMNGYYKNPEMTKQALDSDGWLHTGDVGFYDDDGEVFLVDRISEFILSYGINISPMEIEAVLGTHSAVSQVAVIGIPDEIVGQYPMAVVSLVPGKTVTEQELISLVDKNLPEIYKLKGGVKFLDKLPRTVTGKIAKKQLRDMFAN